MNGNRAVTCCGFWRRVGATALDWVIFLVVVNSVLYLLYGPGYASIDPNMHGPYQDTIEGLLAVLAPPVLTVVLWRELGGTPGKLLSGCLVVDARTGDRVSWRQAMVRLVGYLVSTITLFVGFLWIGWDRHKQGFHDKLAGTLIVAEDESQTDPGELLEAEK